MSKNYLIVGASSGIGEACVKEFADGTDSLCIVARRKDKLTNLRDSLPGDIIVYPFDLMNIEDVGQIFNICSEKNIKFDGMIYCAGVDGTWPIKANNYAKMQEMMTINCFAFVEICKKFFSKRFSNDNASIVAISSIASIKLDKGMSSYCASKAALNAYVKVMSKEFKSRGFRVNAILPAGVDTPMTQKKLELLSSEEKGTLIPAGNIAKQVKFLMSEEARFINGELMVIGAGMEY